MRILTALLLAGSLALAACGGSSDSGSGSGSSSSKSSSSSGSSGGAAPASGGGSKLSLKADPSALKFDTTTLSAKAGKVTVDMSNPSSIPHAIAVEGNGVDKDGKTVMKDGTSTVSVDLKPGTYTFYCPVDGHKAAGMKGTLTVK